jgi:hypothetical protein
VGQKWDGFAEGMNVGLSDEEGMGVVREGVLPIDIGCERESPAFNVDKFFTCFIELSSELGELSEMFVAVCVFGDIEFLGSKGMGDVRISFVRGGNEFR